jgi:hypothetical protein
VLHAVGSVSSKDPYSGSFFRVCNSDRDFSGFAVFLHGC